MFKKLPKLFAGAALITTMYSGQAMAVAYHINQVFVQKTGSLFVTFFQVQSTVDGSTSNCFSNDTEIADKLALRLALGKKVHNFSCADNPFAGNPAFVRKLINADF